MSKYIDADLLRKEIDRRYEENRERARYDDYHRGMNDGLDHLETFLDTLPEQPVEGLEEKDFVEEVRQYYSNNCTWDALKQPMLSIITRCARHFAEWGMNQCPLPEDTTIFLKGVAEGKRLMMEEAVDGMVMDFSSNLPRPQVDIRLDPGKYHTGDKVKVIVIKED